MSPDGQIAYTKISARFLDCGVCVGESEIYVMGADGSKQVRLTNNEMDDYNPVWSPDSRKIAFERWQKDRYQTKAYSEIYVIDADGSNLTPLTTNLNGYL